MSDAHEALNGRIALTTFYKRNHLIGKSGTLPDNGQRKILPLPLLMKQKRYIFTNLPGTINHGWQNR